MLFFEVLALCFRLIFSCFYCDFRSEFSFNFGIDLGMHFGSFLSRLLALGVNRSPKCYQKLMRNLASKEIRFRGRLSPIYDPWLVPGGGKGGGKPPPWGVGGLEERKKRRKEVGRQVGR